jgi:polysaccharide pyruvyl transferase WcaK-like protein
MNIALVGINPYNGNRGVGALGYSILFLLEEIAKEYNVRFSYFILELVPPFLGHSEIIINNKKIHFTGLRSIHRYGIKGLGKKILFFSDYRQYPKFDYVLDMSEGDGFSDIYGINVFYWHNCSKLYFINRHIKLMLLPQTIGPFNNLKIKNNAVKTIEKCDLVLTRDKLSYNFLKEKTNQDKIDEIIDIAFFMPFSRKFFSSEFLHVGINISALLWHGGYTKDNQFNLKIDYKSVIKQIIDYFLTISDVKIHLVPHVFDINQTIENDYAVAAELLEQYQIDRILLAPFFLTPIFAKDYISGLDFFIGARMHATIAAFSTEVPIYPMS